MVMTSAVAIAWTEKVAMVGIRRETNDHDLEKGISHVVEAIVCIGLGSGGMCPSEDEDVTEEPIGVTACGSGESALT